MEDYLNTKLNMEGYFNAKLQHGRILQHKKD